MRNSAEGFRKQKQTDLEKEYKTNIKKRLCLVRIYSMQHCSNSFRAMYDSSSSAKISIWHEISSVKKQVKCDGKNKRFKEMERQ